MGSDSAVLRRGRQGSPLLGTDLPQAASSNNPANIMLEAETMDCVKCQVSSQAKAAADDFFLDLDGAAEDRPDPAELQNSQSL
jgi:hypothetical protein